MGHMKDLDRRIRQGGDDAIAAACELAGIAKERRAAGGEAVTDIVTRLRDWRSVHLARLHILMAEAADEMERLSANGDCPAPETRTNPDNVGKELAQEIACLRSDISRRANLESGLRAGVVQLQDELRRLKAVIAASQRIFTPVAWAVAIGNEGLVLDGIFLRQRDADEAEQDNDRRLAALQALAGLDEELGLPRRTPAENATPSEGSEQSGCTITDAERVSLRSENTAIYENPNAPTLTDVERAAVEWCVEMALNSATDCAAEINTLRSLLERQLLVQKSSGTETGENCQ